MKMKPIMAAGADRKLRAKKSLSERLETVGEVLLIAFLTLGAAYLLWAFVSFVDVVTHNTVPGSVKWLGEYNYFSVFLRGWRT